MFHLQTFEADIGCRSCVNWSLEEYHAASPLFDLRAVNGAEYSTPFHKFCNSVLFSVRTCL